MYYIQYGIKLGDLFLHHGILQEPISMAIDVFANFQVNVTILIDKDGIRYFYFRNTLDGLDKATKMKDIISAEEALKKIENIYDTIILTTPITISKIWLEYLPIPNWKETSEIEVRPYWCIQVDEMNSQGKEASEVFRINAITGGDLSYGE